MNKFAKTKCPCCRTLNIRDFNSLSKEHILYLLNASLDNTHILDSLNNIIKYKVDINNKQYIDILDNTQKIIKIYYEYKDNIDYDKDYFKEFNNIIKKVLYVYINVYCVCVF